MGDPIYRCRNCLSNEFEVKHKIGRTVRQCKLCNSYNNPYNDKIWVDEESQLAELEKYIKDEIIKYSMMDLDRASYSREYEIKGILRILRKIKELLEGKNECNKNS